jgi:hypothetical protein
MGGDHSLDGPKTRWLHLRFVVWRLKSLDEFRRVNPQPCCDLEQVVQAQVAPASLDLPEEGPVDAGLVGQRFLTQPQGFTAGTDAFAEDARG